MKIRAEIINFSNMIYLLCVMVALVMLFSVIKNIIKTQNWSIAFGKIISMDVVQNDNLEISIDGGTFKGTGFSCSVKYEYEISGKVYYGSRISFIGFETTSKKYINRMLKKYKVGTNVIVYFNPKNFSDCVLERVNLITIISLIFILLFISLFVFLLCNKII